MNFSQNASRNVVIAIAFFAVLAVAPFAFAADDGAWGWGDYGSYDTWSDYGSYDTWNDYGTSDNWSDYGAYDNWSDYGTYGSGGTYYDDQSGTYYDDFSGTYYDDQSGTYYDDFSGTYYDDVSGTYYDDVYGSNSYGCSLCGGSYGGGSYGGGSYGGSFGGGYSTGGGYYIPPMTVAPPKYPSYPVGGGSNTNISNTSVTNTSITNIDNSINDSFNNYNSNNVVLATPPAPVVYPAPYCVINQAQSYGYGSSSVYLSWTSTNATTAYLSNVGTVQINGSQTVWPTTSTTYVLTVYGQNGQSAQCQTSVTASSPYVALTQIPYTGFDLGTFGNAMYWAVLASFAAAASYLVIYFKGGALAFAGAVAPKRRYAPVVAPMAPILVEKQIAATPVSPIVAAIRKNGTTDSMAIVSSKDGSMPKIVIDRS